LECRGYDADQRRNHSHSNEPFLGKKSGLLATGATG